eukprot:2639240-Rhodomonas_salina.1
MPNVTAVTAHSQHAFGGVRYGFGGAVLGSRMAPTAHGVLCSVLSWGMVRGAVCGTEQAYDAMALLCACRATNVRYCTKRRALQLRGTEIAYDGTRASTFASS